MVQSIQTCSASKSLYTYEIKLVPGILGRDIPGVIQNHEIYRLSLSRVILSCSGVRVSKAVFVTFFTIEGLILKVY